MLNINESKNMNKKKKKRKKNEMALEDYAKKYNLNLELELSYEGYTKKTEENRNQSNYLIYQSNVIKSKKNETPIKRNNENNINKKESVIEDFLFNSGKNINTGYQKHNSSSTNNSSGNDEERKSINENNVKKIIKNAIKENKVYKITNAINNSKILEEYKNHNFYNYNNIYKGNNNFNYFINDKFNYFLTYNYYYYTHKLKNIQNDLNEIEKQIKELENNSLSELFLIFQSNDLFNYIKQKNQISMSNDINDNDPKKEKILEHPYFYINHDEEKQINNILYLVEGLFLEENLKYDFYLLNMLNRDGYVSLKQLEKHPQIYNFKIKEIHLNAVFSEHRENEITETVETFDDILIRNKKWKIIKKELKDIDKIKENSINSTKSKKDLKMKKLLEQKEKCIKLKIKTFYQNQANNNNIKIQQLKNTINFNFNNIYNNFNIYNNNVYNNFYYNPRY